MSPVERRAYERAMHESYLVVKTGPNDMGSRPLNGPFASPDLSLGADGRPRATIWNLGTREVRGVVTEFAFIPAGMPVRPENKNLIGLGNPANIPANNFVTVNCTVPWRRTSHADILVVTAYHPDLDPVKVECDPLADRHVGQMTYPWAGGFEGVCPGSNGGKVAIQMRPANQGLYNVRVYVAVSGRLPTNPQINRPMAPTGNLFRWQQSYSFKKEDWELTMVDNHRITVRCRTRFTDHSGRQDFEMTGTVTRSA